MRTKFIRTFIVFVLITFIVSSQLIFSQNNNTSDQTDKTWTIDQCVKTFSINDTIGTSAGYQYWFFNKDFLDGRTIKMSVVAPHSATHPPHKHSEDEFFFVLDGKAEFFLDGKTRDGDKYSAFYCPRNSLHGIRNIGDTELKYLVIKKYENKN